MKKLTRDKLPDEEYTKVVEFNQEDASHYEIHAHKLNSEEMIQCPHDDTSYVSGVQPDGSVIYSAKGITVEKNEQYWKNLAIRIKERHVRLQADFNEISHELDSVASKAAVHRTD